jgi:hypothetical protein
MHRRFGQALMVSEAWRYPCAIRCGRFVVDCAASPRVRQQLRRDRGDAQPIDRAGMVDAREAGEQALGEGRRPGRAARGAPLLRRRQRCSATRPRRPR